MTYTCSYVSGEIGLREHLWGRSPFLVRRGAEVARRADRGEAHEGFTQLRAARMRKTLLLLCGSYCVLARERWVLQYTRAAREPGREWVSSPLHAHGASFYMLKGLPTGGSVGG